MADPSRTASVGDGLDGLKRVGLPASAHQRLSHAKRTLSELRQLRRDVECGSSSSVIIRQKPRVSCRSEDKPLFNLAVRNDLGEHVRRKGIPMDSTLNASVSKHLSWHERLLCKRRCALLRNRFTSIATCQAICLPYDGVQSLPPRRVHLNPVVSHDSAELKNRGISAILRDMVDPMALRWFDVARSVWLQPTRDRGPRLSPSGEPHAAGPARPPAAPTHRRPAPPARRTRPSAGPRPPAEEVVTIVTPDRGRAEQDTP